MSALYTLIKLNATKDILGVVYLHPNNTLYDALLLNNNKKNHINSFSVLVFSSACTVRRHVSSKVRSEGEISCGL